VGEAQVLEEGIDDGQRRGEEDLEAVERWDEGIESPNERACTARLLLELPKLEAAFERAGGAEPTARLGLVLHLAYQRRGPFARRAELIEAIGSAAESIGDPRWIARAEPRAGAARRSRSRGRPIRRGAARPSLSPSDV
jgi:hypothetical protein